jgi:hypothetical protein
MKIFPRRKFIVMTAYIKKKPQRSQTNNLFMDLPVLEKQEEANIKINKMKEIIKINAEINEMKAK